jgi:hypothetical protein
VVSGSAPQAGEPAVVVVIVVITIFTTVASAPARVASYAIVLAVISVVVVLNDGILVRDLDVDVWSGNSGCRKGSKDE